MYNSLRRKMLFWIVTLPVVGKGIAKGSSLGLRSQDESEPKPLKDALHAIRAFNTVQMTYKLKHHSFGSATELMEAFTAKKSHRHSTTDSEKKPCVDLEGAELIRGWTYKLHLSPKKDDYLIVIKSGLNVMACGDPGVIYLGKLASDIALPGSYVPVSKLWPDALFTLSREAVAAMSPPSRTSVFFRRVGFMNMNVSTAFVECGCTCGSSPQNDCWTLGFPSCIYCCCGNTTGCCWDAYVNGEQCGACRCIGCACLPCIN